MAENLNADYIVCSTDGFGDFEKVLHTCGFNHKVNVRNNMMIACLLNPKLNKSDIVGFDSWHITQDDGETEIDF